VDDSKTLLVDAPSLFYRALFSSPDEIRTPGGDPINAAHGFFRMLARLIEIHDPTHLACAADENWRPAWRVELVESYKDFRAAAGSAQEDAEARLASQVPVIYGFLEMCDIETLGHPDYEAEDVIGTLAERAAGKVVIFSGDRDLFQLVCDPKVTVHWPVKGVSNAASVTEAYIAERYGIPGRAYRDFAVLRGDPSDGLPGVKGVGEKTAAALVAGYGGIEGIIEALERGESSSPLAKVRRDLDYVRRALEVTTIVTDVPLPESELARPVDLPTDEILIAADRLGIRGPVSDLLAALLKREK